MTLKWEVGSPMLTRAKSLWDRGVRRSGIARALSREFNVEITPNMIAGLTTRYNWHAASRPPVPLSSNSAAIRDSGTKYPSRVRSVPEPAPRSTLTATDSGHLLISGRNQRKLGVWIEKGDWKGMPVFSLALEERATCPSTCACWSTCYGNSMHLAIRYRHGSALERGLERELAELQALAPIGFVVRLHLLGDFYSVEYVELWAEWLKKYPALRVFGYTAWGRRTDIGRAVARLAHRYWDRFAVRLSSSEPGPERAVTIWGEPPAGTDGIVCPAERGLSASCATCGLCWSPSFRHRPIFFMAHGGR
jgi:hypothetical protein